MWPEKEKIENLVKNEEAILIAGEINVTGQMLYWRSIGRADIGDYAIVQNKSGYDLVKVAGIVYTTITNASKFSNTKYENMKRVVNFIKKERLEDIKQLF